MVKTPYIPLGINSIAGTDICHIERRCNLPHAPDIYSVMGAINSHTRQNMVKSPHMPLGINSVVGADVYRTRRTW